MLDETKYVESVWNRYNAYCSGTYKNDFYETRVYREEKDFTKILKMVAMFTICITTMFGAVYAGRAIYNNYIKNAIYIEINDQMISKNWINENMKLSNDGVRIYYEVITSYNEYQKYKEKFKIIEDFSESDFENNFVILMCGKTIHIEQITTDEETISVNYKLEYKEEQNVQTILIPKEQYRENIKLARVEESISFTNIAIGDITTEYSKEQAIADGCVVFENDEIISNNENKIYEFVEKSKNGEEGFIRIVKYNNKENSIEIREIECKNKENFYSYKIINNGKDRIVYKQLYKCIEIRDEENVKYLVVYNDAREVKLTKF